MVLMSASKSARNQASIANNTKIYGSIGGLIPLIGTPASIRAVKQNAGNGKIVIPSDPIKGLDYMQNHGLIQKNPASSGGVGRRVLMHFH